MYKLILVALCTIVCLLQCGFVFFFFLFVFFGRIEPCGETLRWGENSSVCLFLSGK